MTSETRIDPVIAEFVEGLREVYGGRLMTVALFGSRARGDQRPGSDVDLLVIADGMPPSYTDRLAEIRALIDRTNRELARVAPADPPPCLSVVLKDRAEGAFHAPLYLDLTEDARLLVDRDGFFAGILTDVRARMAELGSRRIWLGQDRWYWDLKPDSRPGEVIEI
jgi:hypothetical protein